MPKKGMEPVRRRELIDAVIATIHDRGAAQMTMGDIANRAGVSAGLAHHYFGGKKQLLAATMRHLLTELGARVREKLQEAKTPDERVRAIIAANLGPEQCSPEVISSWLAFYDQARTDAGARQLLQIYARRLLSNLTHALRDIVPDDRAPVIADSISSMIDGIWLRAALGYGPTTPETAIAMAEDHFDAIVAQYRGEKR